MVNLLSEWLKSRVSLSSSFNDMSDSTKWFSSGQKTIEHNRERLFNPSILVSYRRQWSTVYQNQLQWF